MTPQQDPATPTRIPGAGRRAVVVGAGVAGLTAALELVRRGRIVTVLEASAEPGGLVARHTVAGIELDAGAESFSIRGKAVAALAAELGLSEAVVPPLESSAWLYRAEGAVPLPKAGILGIPGMPLARDVVDVIGWSGALRAQLDRIMPILHVGKYTNLANLVRRRMGAKVLDQLVAPVASGVYTADVSQLEVDRVAPGLNRALTRAGSLSGGVLQLRESAPAGSQVAGLDGGIFELVLAVRGRIESLGGTVQTGAAVERVTAGTDGSWTVRAGFSAKHVADELVIATDSATALRLLGTATPAWGRLAAAGWPSGPQLELVTLVLSGGDSRLEVLRDAPRGTGVLVAKNSSVRAKALTHATAKWPWLAARTSDHVIRLSYGRGDGAADTAELDDAAVRALAIADASTLLGVDIPADSVKGMARTALRNSPPAGLTGQSERVASVAEVQAAHNNDPALPALAVTGAWLSGTGLAQVVPHARTQIEALVERGTGTAFSS